MSVLRNVLVAFVLSWTSVRFGPQGGRSARTVLAGHRILAH